MNLLIFILVVSQAPTPSPQWELEIDRGGTVSGSHRSNILGVTKVWTSLPSPTSSVIIDSVTYGFYIGDEVMSTTARWYLKSVGGTPTWVRFMEDEDLDPLRESQVSQYTGNTSDMIWKRLSITTNSPSVAVPNIKAGSTITKVLTSNVNAIPVPTNLWNLSSSGGNPFEKDTISMKSQFYTGFDKNNTLVIFYEVANTIQVPTREFFAAGLPFELDPVQSPRGRDLVQMAGEWKGINLGGFR